MVIETMGIVIFKNFRILLVIKRLSTIEAFGLEIDHFFLCLVTLKVDFKCTFTGKFTQVHICLVWVVCIKLKFKISKKENVYIVCTMNMSFR